MNYANDYLTNGRFTGSGDEALQEKFFELAKPSVGFRMTQPQIDLLQNSRSWMNSAEAHIATQPRALGSLMTSAKKSCRP